MWQKSCQSEIHVMLIWTWHLPELPKIQEIIFNIYNPTFLQMDDDRCRNAKQTFVFQFWSFLLMILKNVKSVAAAPGRNMSLISSAEAMGQYSSTKVLPIFRSANNSYKTYVHPGPSVKLSKLWNIYFEQKIVRNLSPVPSGT